MVFPMGETLRPRLILPMRKYHIRSIFQWNKYYPGHFLWGKDYAIMHGKGKGMLQTLKKTIKLHRVLGADQGPLAKPCKSAAKADMYLGPVFRKVV